MKKITATIEIPKDSNVKYEIQKYPFEDRLVVDRILNHYYPANYGFVPHTKWDDGDALDVFVIGPQLVPGCFIQVFPLAVIDMTDNRISDVKLVAATNIINPTVQIEVIKEFLLKYKKGVKINSISIREKDIVATLQKAQELCQKTPSIEY